MQAADSVPSAKPLRLLAIGNSFSGNATHWLPELAKAGGHTLVMRSASMGGATMEQHWQKAQKFEADPADKAGQYINRKGLKELLQAEPWDYVTLQQASIKSHDAATYRPFARQLFDYVEKYAPGAQVLLHQTWAYRVDDPRFTTTAPKAGEPKTQAEMHQQLSAAYDAVAAELGVRQLPVGNAFALANNDPEWRYQPPAKMDRATFAYPALPEQRHSLNVGYNWKKDAKGAWALAMDGHHASILGEYLGACVWYEVLFGESPVGLKFAPKGVSPEEARYLQETAHRAVVEKAGTKPQL